MTGKTSPVRRKRRPQRSNTLKDIGRLLGVVDNAHTDRKDTPDLACSLEVGAATTVSEPDSGDIRFVKYRAFDPVRLNRVKACEAA